jgi:hypothetical protein
VNPEPHPERFWRRRIRRVRREANAAAWIDAALPWTVGGAIVFTGIVLVGRRFGFPAETLAAAGALFALAIALLATWRARPRFFSERDARVRLEVALRLNARLSAAAAGVGPWPPAAPGGPGWRWDWARVAGPTALAASAVALAFLWPLPVAAHTNPGAPTQRPPAVEALAELVERLETESPLDPAAVDEMRRKLDELQSQPAERWYDHGSLEAAESLRAETEANLQSLERELAAAADALAALENGENLSREQLAAAAASLADALSAMEAGRMPVDRKLLQSMKEIDPSQLAELSPERLRELRERCKQAGGQCRSGRGLPDADTATALEPSASDTTVGDSASGGTGGGGSHAPLSLKNDAKAGGATESPLPSAEGDPGLPGNVAQISAGDHTADPNRPWSGTGGTAAVAGSGGDAVWKSDVAPDERAVLERFFRER